MGGDNNRYWGEGMHHANDGWWGGPLHVIVFLLLLALLVAGVVWLVRHFSGGALAPAAAGPALAGPDPAVAALRMRYAKGEVSREEFQHTMEDLGGEATPPTAS
jgi:uncharacterized membrane protein